MRTVLFAQIENRANVRMIKRRSQARFPIETFHICFFGGEVRRQHFDDDGAAQFRVDGL
jgi:hypothetical protein